MHYFQKSFLGFFILLISSISFADTTAENLIDVLRKTPANVTGLISLDKEMKVDLPNPLVKVKVAEKEEIYFNFSEHHLSLRPDKSVVITILGVPVTIQEIYYDDQRNRFSVKTKTPLPRGMGQDLLNKQIEAKLNETYRPKVQQAFKELTKIRSNKNLDDVNQVIQSIAGIFAGASKEPAPSIKGHMTLNLSPTKNEKFVFGKWHADLKANDNFAVTLHFEKKPGKVSIHGLDLGSQKGIRFYSDTKVPEIVSIDVKELKFSESGPEIKYDIGAEEAIAGFQLLMDTFKSIGSRQALVATCDCETVQLKYSRSRIDGPLREQLAKFIKANRKTLLEAGATPQLLDALD